MTGKEAELCLFVLLGIGSKAMLNAKRSEAQYIIQGETNSTTPSGMKITNRVRRIATFDERGESKGTVYTAATKFRLPRTEGSINSECIETETAIDENGYRAVQPFAQSIHHKFRHVIPMDDLHIEIDHYIPPGEIYGGTFAKIDIEGGDETELDRIIEVLRRHEITFVNIINPPGIENDNIKANIDNLMSYEYNHADTGGGC